MVLPLPSRDKEGQVTGHQWNRGVVVCDVPLGWHGAVGTAWPMERT